LAITLAEFPAARDQCATGKGLVGPAVCARGGLELDFSRSPAKGIAFWMATNFAIIDRGNFCGECGCRWAGQWAIQALDVSGGDAQ